MSVIALLVLVCLWTESGSLRLPSYIKACSVSDPNLNECAKKSAIAAVPQFIDGDPKYRVPPLDPIIINELAVDRGSANFGLHFLATNASLGGFRSVVFRDVRMDLVKRHVEFELTFPTLTVNSKYNVTGQVLILPITGNGDAHIVLKDVDAVFRYDYGFVTRKGKEYVSPKNAKLDVDVKDATIHLDNLFNGDKLLGDNMNIFLNEKLARASKGCGAIYRRRYE